MVEELRFGGLLDDFYHENTIFFGIFLEMFKKFDVFTQFHLRFYEFREKNSICKHNHGKFSKKAFQSQFFKRDFKHLEGPLKHVLESGFDKMQNIKPKVLLKIMKDEEMMTPNILKGFTLYHKSFKKKFDNLVRKVKESLKMDLNNSTANTLNSVSLEDFDPVFKGEVKEEQEEIFDESEEGKEQIKIELDFKEKKEERSSFEKFIDELENPKWIIPFTFY